MRIRLDRITPFPVPPSLMNRARMPRTDVKTSFYLPRPLLRAAKARAAEESISLRAWLVRTVEAALARPATEETTT